MSPPDPAGLLDAAISAAQRDRRLRYEALVLPRWDALLYGEPGKPAPRLDGDPRPRWMWTLEQCERMRETLRRRART